MGRCLRGVFYIKCTVYRAPLIQMHRPPPAARQKSNTSDMQIAYLLLRYQAKALPFVPSPNGVGTSAIPGLATGCLKYTAAQIFWLTSKYLGMKANALMYSRGCQGVRYGLEGSIGLSRRSSRA